MHLIRRFFGFLTAKPLTPTEQQHVHDTLDPHLARVFFRQRYEDQRHAFDVERRTDSIQCAQAALLHDIGKTESDLGAFSRSLATLWNKLRLPTTGRWSSYINHGAQGASELARLGADNLAIAFTRDHPGPPPGNIEPRIWRALEDADNA